MEGENYFGRDIATLMYDIVVAKRKSAEQGELEFTDRESDVIRLCHEGKTAREIAELMGISRRTVESHKTNIFKKLGINSTYDMIQAAIRCGIISPDG